LAKRRRPPGQDLGDERSVPRDQQSVTVAFEHGGGPRGRTGRGVRPERGDRRPVFGVPGGRPGQPRPAPRRGNLGVDDLGDHRDHDRPVRTRPEYSGHYFAALVVDPDGNNIEAVFHRA